MTIPPMLAQPFIENSIEHGFKHKDDAVKKMHKCDVERELKHSCMYKH